MKKFKITPKFQVDNLKEDEANNNKKRKYGDEPEKNDELTSDILQRCLFKY